MKPLIIAQLGCGYWGKNLLRSFTELSACRVKWLVDHDPQQRTSARNDHPQLQTSDDWQAPLRDPETNAVVIATPAATHFDTALQALQAGKDVFVEKPMALRQVEGEELVALA